MVTKSDTPSNFPTNSKGADLATVKRTPPKGALAIPFFFERCSLAASILFIMLQPHHSHIILLIIHIIFHWSALFCT
jgi:hypothetical protein